MKVVDARQERRRWRRGALCTRITLETISEKRLLPMCVLARDDRLCGWKADTYMGVVQLQGIAVGAQDSPWRKCANTRLEMLLVCIDPSWSRCYDCEWQENRACCC